MKQILVVVCAKNASLWPDKASEVQREPLWPNKVRSGFFFMAGRSKNEPGTDFSAVSVAQALLIAEDLQTASLPQIEEAINDGYIEEIYHDN